MHTKFSDYALLMTNSKTHLLFHGLQMVLKTMIYEIIVFMVGFYPGSIKSNLYSATTVSGGTLPCLNFSVSHSDMIYIYSRRDYMRQYQGTYHNYWTSVLPSAQNSSETSYLTIKTYKSSTTFWSE